MTAQAQTRRRGAGRPLVAILSLLTVWVVIRASVWEPPFALPSPETLFAQAQADAGGSIARSHAETESGQTRVSRERRALAWLADFGASRIEVGRARIEGRRYASAAGARRDPIPFARARSSASHQRLFAAAYGTMPAYASLIERAAPQGLSGTPGQARRLSIAGSRPARPGAREPGANTAPRDRWAADAWLLVREGSNRQAFASVNPAALGANQVGIVVRYALAPATPLDPHAYVRVSKALVADGEGEAAAGVSIAPLRKVPLRIHGELRVTDRAGLGGAATEVRPAAFVTTGLARQKLMPGVEGEAYLQAGYVGGDFATGFVDGKATLETPLIKREAGRVAVGAGAWGGAQRDASRFDIGPTASVSLATGRVSLRGSIDYRFRVAGDAVPGDGLAVTLAASF